MKSDRHILDLDLVRPWHRVCAHCRRPFAGRFGSIFGSRACKQAAYRRKVAMRERLSKEAVPVGPARDRKAALLRRQKTAGGAPAPVAAKGGRE